MESPAAVGRVWFITGGSSGLGRALVEAAAARGDRVAATARRAEDVRDLSDIGNTVLGLHADITDPAAVRSAAAATVDSFGRIDVLVNNAGYTLFGAVEEATDQEIRAQFETNVFGLMDVTRVVLPVMRRQGSGFIIMISSVAGVRASQGLAYYAASKHAVEGFSESLAREIAPQGLRLTIVEPGTFRTNVLGSSMITATPAPEYSSTVGAFRSIVAGNDGTQPGDPAVFAQSVLRLSDESTPPLRLPLDPGATQAIRPKLEDQLREIENWGVKWAAGHA